MVFFPWCDRSGRDMGMVYPQSLTKIRTILAHEWRDLGGSAQIVSARSDCGARRAKRPRPCGILGEAAGNVALISKLETVCHRGGDQRRGSLIRGTTHLRADRSRPGRGSQDRLGQIEALENQPEAQAQFEQPAGQGKHHADAVSEHLSDRADHEDDVTDKAPHRQRTRHQTPDEERRTQDEPPDAPKRHADLVAEKAPTFEQHGDGFKMAATFPGHEGITERGEECDEQGTDDGGGSRGDTGCKVAACHVSIDGAQDRKGQNRQSDVNDGVDDGHQEHADQERGLPARNTFESQWIARDRGDEFRACAVTREGQDEEDAEQACGGTVSVQVVCHGFGPLSDGMAP